MILEKYKRLWTAKLSLFEEDHSPYRQILLASLPIVGSLFLVSFYTIVDTVIISRYNGTREIASVLNFLPFEQILTLSPMQALGTATASQISVAIGAKSFPDAEMIFSVFFVVGCCIAVLVPLVCVPVLPLVLPSLGVIREYVSDVLRYGYIAMTCMPLCNLLGPAMVPILRCENKAGLVMLRQILGVVLNIILDLIFITALHLGNSGAAIATAISMFVTGAWISSHFFICKQAKLKAVQENRTRFIIFNPARVRCSKKQLSLVYRLLGLTVSSYIQFFLLNFCALLSLFLHKYWMPDAVAHVRQVGVSIAARTTLIFSNPISGLQNGILPVLGYTVGQKSPRRIYEVSKAGLVILLIATSAQLILFQLLAPFIIRIYNLDDAYYIAGVRALRILNAMVPMLSFSTLALVLFQVQKKQYHALGLQMAKVGAQVLWQLVVPYIQKDSKELVVGVPFSDVVTGIIGLGIVIVEFRRMRQRIKQELDAEFTHARILRTFDLSKDVPKSDTGQITLIYQRNGDSKRNRKSLAYTDRASQSIEMVEVSSTVALPIDSDNTFRPASWPDLVTASNVCSLCCASPLTIHQSHDKDIDIELSSDISELNGETLPCYYAPSPQRTSKK
ncbi:Na+ driven multidrug efflux pump [Giardia lamblia P15]|uniref:Na+ driven multidrug efflux pump n=1 Tax=Giardia intestinalis (strain P15) TaxID=658858 RepID=E1F5A2_GIAIA|nr:Na+ driven multidrug efflux pump [Giardia lamblia P15]